MSDHVKGAAPERLQEIRDWVDQKALVCQQWRVPPGTTIRIIRDLLAHVEAQDAEIAALQRGQGAFPINQEVQR